MSDLLNQASLVYIPSGYKEDTAYSVIPTDGSGDLTFTRASDGTRVNSQGLVERVPWNLLQQSNTFNTTWAALNGGAVTGGQAGYDGTNNAWLLSKTASGGFIYQTANSFNGQYTISIYAKANASTFIRLNGNAITDSSAFFNLSTGTVHTYTNCVAQIDSVGSGWYKCSMTSTDALLDYVNIYPAEITGISATTGSVYIQDAQLNEGTLKPYFPTTDRLNVPRLDYSNGCPSLLLEPQRTNLTLYSEQFDNGWSSSVTVVANDAISPDGTQTADKLYAATGTGKRVVRTSTITASTAYTFSVFAKSAGQNFIYITDVDNAVNNVWFDVSNGTFSTPVEGTASMVDYGNGWYRCIVTTTSTGTTGYSYIGISSSSGSNTFTADGTSGIYIWGAQLEAGSYPTSYIPTTSASVTRVADECYKTGISSLIGQTEGTLFVQANLSNTTSDSQRGVAELNNGGSLNRITLFRNTNGTLRLFIRESATSQADITYSTLTTGSVKIAVAYASNDIAFYVNGTLVGTDTSATIPTCSDFDLGIQENDTNKILGDSISQAVLFPTRLTNAELAALTTL